MTQTQTPITIPTDFDNDVLTYRFARVGNIGYFNRYSIERSINGGKPEIIGTVIKTRDGDWQRPAEWSATATDGTLGGGNTRAKAVSSLEHNLQGPEYAAAKQAQWRAEDEQHRLDQEAAKDAMLARIAALDANHVVPEAFITRMRDHAGSPTAGLFTIEDILSLFKDSEV